jgi:hypothetical protein
MKRKINLNEEKLKKIKLNEYKKLTNDNLIYIFSFLSFSENLNIIQFLSKEFKEISEKIIFEKAIIKINKGSNDNFQEFLKKYKKKIRNLVCGLPNRIILKFLIELNLNLKKIKMGIKFDIKDDLFSEFLNQNKNLQKIELK